MFKPSSSPSSSAVVRAISRSFLRPHAQILNTTRRTLYHSQALPSRPPPRTLSRKNNNNGQAVATIAAGGLIGFTAYQMLGLDGGVVNAEAPLHTLEEQKSNVSVQHIQIQRSLEHPGVYAWGDNSGKVVAPDSKEKVIKTPRRLPFFDGVLLRDLQLAQDAGVAVDERGDVLQWGCGYADDGIEVPAATLKGKNIGKVVVSKDKIIALSRDSTVYSLPISKKHQLEGAKPIESSWIPGLSSTAAISYRVLKPSLGYLEKVTDVAAGLEHVLVLTSSGRVFSSAAAFTYPSRGQMGIRGLAWETRPAGKPVDTLQEITAPGGHGIVQIAAGDYHSVVLSRSGEVFTFGDNAYGQLGLIYNPPSSTVDVPNPLSLAFLYPQGTTTARVTGIAAGGLNSYFMVDALDSGATTADVLACGTGIYGNLGNGHWTHRQVPPTKIRALSGLLEFNEATQTVVPIRLQSLRVGATHSAAVMDNATQTSAQGSSGSDVNYGSDVVWWGGNEFYQLGTGKRNNCNVPVYIPPLDGVPTDLVVRKAAAADLLGSSNGGGSSGGTTDCMDSEGSGRAVAGNDQVHRFQLTPKGRVVGGKKAVQAVVCGRGNSAVYMKAVS